MSDGDGGHHRNYIAIWAVLVVLLLVSVFGPMLEIRIITLLTAFGVAGVKAFLVVKHFMHLDVEKPIVRWLLATCVVLMALLFAGVAPDVMKDDGANWVKGPEFHPDLVEGAGAEEDHDGHH